MTREEIIADNPILTVLQRYGLEFRRNGREFSATCPFHEDKHPSLRVNLDKATWYCDPCDKGGSVIDFVMAMERCDFTAALAKLTRKVAAQKQVTQLVQPREVCSYDYCDENGVVLYQAVRYEPKTFRQRSKNSDGQWVWTMDGVRRVLYRLPDVLAASDLFVVEGEKDADSLAKLGFTATCNVGGAKKWLDSYSDALTAKNVVVIPDNDAPGKEHAQIVIKSLAGKAKTVFHMELSAPDKDISDLIVRLGDDAKAGILGLLDGLKPINPAPDLPIKSVAEMEEEYRQFVTRAESKSLNLNRWLPSLGASVRSMVPGDVIVFLADTGIGKTSMLQNMAYHSGLPTLIFEMELPTTTMFERLLQMATQTPGDDIFQAYKKNCPPDWRLIRELSNIFICPLSRLTPIEMERIINLAELKMGQRPVLVMVDYVQLLQGIGGSRYERASYAAEQMKIIAKSTNTIVVIASQISRPADKESTGEVFLHSAKDSGSIENSAGLVIGAWREGEHGEVMKLKILKNSKGRAGKVIDCNYNGETMRITEMPVIDFNDVPQRTRNVKGIYE